MVPFEDLKYAMFKAEYTFMIAKAKARLGRDVDQGDFYSTAPTPSGAAAEPGRHALSAVLQTLKDEAHVLLLNRQKVGEMAAEMEKHMAARVQEASEQIMGKQGSPMIGRRGGDRHSYTHGIEEIKESDQTDFWSRI